MDNPVKSNLSKLAIFGTAIGELCFGGLVTAAPPTLEERWQALAVDAGLTSPLTPHEQACYQNLASCYDQLTASDTPTRYYTTRVYFHIAEQIVAGNAEAMNLPLQVDKTYDPKFISAKDKVVINKALDMSSKALLNSIKAPTAHQ